MGLVEQLAAAMLGGRRDPCQEHLLGALAGLAARPAGAAECRRPELGLRETLEARMVAMEGRDEWQVRRRSSLVYMYSVPNYIHVLKPMGLTSNMGLRFEYKPMGL
jgi:hypothetical protein